MLRYAALNVVFLAIVAGLAYWQQSTWLRKALPLLVGMVVLTAVFDSIIIGLDIVRYNREFISGIYIGKAPIEDFAYTLAAVILAPLLWNFNRSSK